MEDVIEVMKLLCYEMMELQRTQQDPSAQVGPNSEVVWQLLQQQADILVVLLTAQTGQVRPHPTAGSHPHHAMLYLKNTLCLTCQLQSQVVSGDMGARLQGCCFLTRACCCLFPAGVHYRVCCHCSRPWSPAAHAHARLQVSGTVQSSQQHHSSGDANLCCCCRQPSSNKHNIGYGLFASGHPLLLERT